MFSTETAHSINGVAGRMYARHVRPDAPHLFSAQKWVSERRPVKGYGPKAEIQAEVRFDDSCRNGHATFAITGDISAPSRGGGRVDIAGGCIHEDIAAAFPELAHLIRWHLCSTDGPMHYVANTVYHAGDRDHNGLRAGEASRVVEVIQFGDVPMRYRLEKGLGPFLREICDYNRDGQAAALIPVAVAGGKAASGYQFAPKYQFAGQPPLKWHECAFETEEEAQRFADSFVNHSPAIYALATAWSEGKPRDLDAARRTAIWPEATDADLMAEPAELRAKLEARLPALLEAFRADMAAAGLLCSPVKESE